MTDPYIIPDKQDAYIVIAAPIQKNGVISGVVYFRCDTHILQSIVKDIDVGESEQADSYILSRDGTVIANPDKSLVIAKENIIAKAKASPKDKDLQDLAKIEQAMIRGETGFGQYKYADGTTICSLMHRFREQMGGVLRSPLIWQSSLQPAKLGGWIQMAVIRPSGDNRNGNCCLGWPLDEPTDCRVCRPIASLGRGRFTQHNTSRKRTGRGAHAVGFH